MADTKDKPGTDLAVLSDDAVESALTGGEVDLPAIEDPRAIQQQIIKRILESEDAETVLRGQTALGGREVLGRAFTLKAVRWHASSYAEEGLPVFAVLDVDFLDDGSSAAVTSGAANVMAQAFMLHKLGALPADVQLVESDRDTARGFKPQWLVAA